MVKADYWRRHLTEVHSKPEEVEAIKNLTICLNCYNSSMNQGKTEREALGDKAELPEFDALFQSESEQENIVNIYKHISKY